MFLNVKKKCNYTVLSIIFKIGFFEKNKYPLSYTH